MTSESALLDVPTRTPRGHRHSVRLAGAGLVACLVLGACGGDDDDEAAATTTTTLLPIAATTVPPTTAPPTTTTPPTTTIAYVTEGATVVVANASGVNGAAGRLTDRLAAVGFTTTDATNSADTVGQLSTSRILHVAGDPAAETVAESLREAFGGGDITIEEAAIPVPTESGELGDATVLILMGNDIADKSLEELQNGAPVPGGADDGDGATGTTTETTAATDTTVADDEATDDG